VRRLGDILHERGQPADPGETPRWPREDYCPPCGRAPCQCPICHGAGFYLTALEPRDMRIGHEHTVECECHKASIRQQTVATLAELSILPKLPKLTFERFDATVSGLAEAHAAAVSFADQGGVWLVLHGPAGVGKTHLAAAIGHQLVAKGEGVVMHVVPQLLAEFRRSFSDNQTARYHRLFDGTLNAPVLILDDFGAENTTDWAREQLYLILDDRYRHRAPLVVTTNSLPALEPRVRDRLSDDGVSVVVPIKAGSYRQVPTKFRNLRLLD
jgi:DNA replication protein DnaC